MTRYWTDLARRLTPYAPGEQPKGLDVIKLNTNENPFGPSPRVIEAIQGAASRDLRLYPDPDASALRRALALYHGVEPERIFVGNGSDEVLAFAFAGLLKHSSPVLFPDITYAFYSVYCQLFGIQSETVALDQDMRVRVADYEAGRGPIILANPNAPTGIALSRADIARLVAAHSDVPIVIDEAYVDFGAETAIPLIDDHPNLLVVQTMSKSRGLAGLRVGYAIGQAELVEALRRVKDSFNSYPLDRLAEAGAIASLQDQAYFQETCQAVVERRMRLTAELSSIGFDVLPSSANFVFARHAQSSGPALAQALRAQAILVRHLSGARTSDYLRISIGSDGELDRLLAVLSEILSCRHPPS